MISNVDYAIQRGEKMEVTEITKIRRKVLTMLAKMMGICRTTFMTCCRS